jgi:hypothetical protein
LSRRRVAVGALIAAGCLSLGMILMFTAFVMKAEVYLPQGADPEPERTVLDVLGHGLAWGGLAAGALVAVTGRRRRE